MAKSGGMSLHSGMSKKSASSSNLGVSTPSKSVNSDPTRSGTAPTPKTLGPRSA